MDSEGFMQTFQSELKCSICMNYFIDPVTIDCGHSFCRPCLCLCWEEEQTPKSCPECRTISEKSDFQTNIVLKRLASLARQARAPHIISSEEQICGTHGEAKGLFCAVDKTLLCGTCSECPEHAAHSHSPVQWAAEECRETLLKRMGPLWKMNREMQDNLNQETNKIQSLENYVTLRKVMIKLQYQRIHLFLQKEEQFHLETLEKEAKETLQELKESVFRMTRQKETLKEKYRMLTEMCHSADMELLQDLGNVLEMTELVQMQNPQPVNPEFTCWPVTGMLDMLNNFRVENVLNQKMYIRNVRLSEDNASVTFEDEPHGASRQPQSERFAAWGAQAFTSGRKYWEVDVTQNSDWILGVCKDVWTSDTDISIDSEGAFFLFSMKVNDHYTLSTNSPPLIQYVKRPLGRVGVFLDYDNGTVSFYDVCKGSLIYSSLPSSFSSPLKPYLFLSSL
uniref:Tripartite motif-containing protein 64-like n=1 Tax=Catagonus wagneri TaxID=51154 RepID=A0A8C3VUN0_9CETA